MDFWAALLVFVFGISWHNAWECISHSYL